VGCTIGQGDCYRTKDGRILDLEYATTRLVLRQHIQSLVQEQLKQIGVKIDLQAFEIPDFFATNNNGVLWGGHYQIAEFAYFNGYDPDDHSLFAADQTPDNPNPEHLLGSNVMRYNNLEVDQAELAQQSTADRGARMRAFHTIHQAVLKDLPVMYLFTPVDISCARSDLHNYNLSAVGGELWNVWDWYLG
jgi:ABC-type transport system substrate-binding protein